MSDENQEVEQVEEITPEPVVEFSLTELMAQAAIIDKNLADEDHAAAKAEAMEQFGLVEPGKKGGVKLPSAPPAPSNPNPNPNPNPFE